jgi:DNA-binding beta-propeller fold protein YncE
MFKCKWLVALISMSLAALALAAAGPGYHVAKTYKVGGEGGWDYLTADGSAHRLYISRGTHVIVLDVDSGKTVGDIPDTQGVHGIALAPDLGRGFTSNGREGTVTIFDIQTLKPIGEKVKVGENPDAILYDPATKRVFTFNGRSQDSTAIDAASGKVLGTIKLDGKPEFAASDARGTIFVNIEDKSELTVIDPSTLAVKAKWPLAPCTEPSGLAIDRKHRRLFAGCNKMMAVVDADTGKVVATPAIGEGVDATAYDDEAGLAFASCGEGVLTVVKQDSPDKYSVAENVQTERGARTMALDSKTHDVYTVTAKFGPRPAPTADNPRPRPPILPDSFVVLVVSK